MKNNKGFGKGILCGLLVMIFLGIGAFFILQNRGIVSVNLRPVNLEESNVPLPGSEEVNSKLNEMLSKINAYYLEDIDYSQLVDGMYAGLVKGLEDPYSVYYTKEELKSTMESTEGKYYGIGATMSQDKETGIIKIVQMFEGTPAEEAGLLPEDILYKVDGAEVSDMDLTEVVSLIKGEENTKVTLTIVREGQGDYMDIEVERKEVEVPTIEHEMLEDQVGYIKILQFDVITEEQFNAAMEDLNNQGMEKLVIDLRNNPGGVLSTVVHMLQQMLPEGMIVYTEDKYGEREEYKSDGKHEFTKPLALLVNGNSASASEIFAGAIQDYGIGTLVGTTTFGKGIVQTLVHLDDGSAMKLTISKYYTPKGNNIHGIGIEPDIEIDLTEELKQQSTITKEEDNQLQKALEVLKDK
ncbi:MAG TPA: S41 family peptidase [Candidatus Merdenecus merdavium]|nr:S41 family peptidase [Candidatus Merdenecus merdavium]